MTTAADPTPDTPKKRSKLPLLVGLVLSAVGAGGGFFAVSSGMLGGASGGPSQDLVATAVTDDKPLPVFVALDPLVISLPGANGRDHLRFSAQLEVAPDAAEQVEAVKPRIVDVLNGYLRAVEIAQLEDPAALVRMRAHMLRRVQVVAGEGQVRDLLIMEFVLS
jgi:flagellar FliL protein